MTRGYLTVFLSLSLSVLIGFILLLTGNSIINAGKIRLECASDIGMNSVLAEFSAALQERYDLLYIDVSYLDKDPAVSNIEGRLDFYIKNNLSRNRADEPWKAVDVKDITVSEIYTAAEGKGESMKYQAARYVKESGIVREEAEIFDHIETAKSLDHEDTMQKWSALQEQIAGIELPEILNEKGEWEEVPLGNPADRIFGFAGSDIFYLLSLNREDMGTWCIHKDEYISGREIKNMTDAPAKNADDKLFLTYLCEKTGNYRNRKENSFLQFQMEYIAEGKASDYENMRAVAERLVKWRFAVNVSYIFDNAGLYGEASALAESLYAVQLKGAFKEPVTHSILYACAYLEALSEVKALLNGGRIEMGKSCLNAGIDQVLSGEIPFCPVKEEGLSYEQYLSCMVMLLPDEIRNLRSMDIMEMDIRFLTGNSRFAMDWCVERYRAQILADGAIGDEYLLDRTYGYY